MNRTRDGRANPVTREGLVDRARALLPTIAGRAVEADQIRRLSAGVTDAPPGRAHDVPEGRRLLNRLGRRNEVERLFRQLKGPRRIFTRFEKLDALFLGFILFALIVDETR